VLPSRLSAPPRALRCSSLRLPDDRVVVARLQFVTDVAGQYSVPILGGARKELVPGTPLRVTVQPGPPTALRLTVTLEGATLARSGDQDAHDVVEAVAGRALVRAFE
jgi:hypothetical protein